MWYAFIEPLEIGGIAWGIGRVAPTRIHSQWYADTMFSCCKEWLARRLSERRAEAMRPVIAIDADLRRLAAMKEQECTSTE